jgi:sarcosine oxidase subunit gamma
MNVSVSTHGGLDLQQIVGAGAEACLQRAGYPIPEVVLSAVSHGAGFVARTGRDEFLIAGDGSWQPPASSPPWCFQRSDHLIELSGNGWAHALAAVCPHDLRAMGGDAWLMATVAGVDGWLRTGPDPEAGLLIGCDPSYGHYLETTLREVVSETESLKQ